MGRGSGCPSSSALTTAMPIRRHFGDIPCCKYGRGGGLVRMHECLFLIQMRSMPFFCGGSIKPQLSCACGSGWRRARNYALGTCTNVGTLTWAHQSYPGFLEFARSVSIHFTNKARRCSSRCIINTPLWVAYTCSYTARLFSLWVCSAVLDFTCKCSMGP